MEAVGATPRVSNRLNNSTRNVASTSILTLSRRVGSGSELHCLSANRRTAVTTSATVSGRNARKTQSSGAAENYGSGASLVDARTSATLESKNLCILSAVIATDIGACGGSISVLMECHS